MVTADETVFVLWCRLTGRERDEFDAEERSAFLARPQVAALTATPYEILLDAGIATARRGALPLEHWLGAVRNSSPIDA